MTWKLDPTAPVKPTYRNCVRCLTQYKLFTPYDECQKIVRDFCDNCIGDLTFEQMEIFAEEMNPPVGMLPME